jgi:thiamine pyrophosphate-dependent acetolactate synthase large subunit-like protein
MEGEYRGSRTEFIHWLQDVPDQRAIVAQYCRYTGEIRRPKNIKQVVNRALSFAKSGPAGPVYLQGTREVMEEVIEPYEVKQQFWSPVELGGLSDEHLDLISRLLLDANEPLVITGYSGRNLSAVPLLVKLADIVKGLRVLDTMGSDLSFPADHPAWLGVRYGSHPAIETADVILVIDCDVPWINTQCKPREDAKILHLDLDPLKQQMPLYYIDALLRLRVSSELALLQIVKNLEVKLESLSQARITEFDSRWSALQSANKTNIETIAHKAEARPDGLISSAFLFAKTREVCPSDTIWVVEAVTETANVADQLQATIPGSSYSSGAGGLGWSGGAALGIKLATDAQNGGAGKFVCQIVGDGCFMFSVPSSVFWIGSRYKIPVLTIVINNNGRCVTPLDT